MAGSPVEEIKARLDIVEIVGPYVALKKSGRSFRALCPFHGEKTPSFYVFPDRGSWKCFGCGEGGDVFTFVQKRENLDFVEALRMLAARAGVELRPRAERTPEAEAAEERLRAALAAAELYFKAALEGTAGVAARAYLEQRGVSQESVARFGLGYAPRRGLLKHLESSSFSAEEASEVGLAGQDDSGRRYEMFRERLMFPIRDVTGRGIGFGGRVLGEGQPKYLNGPQTLFFDKSGSLFALDLAREAIRQSGQAVVVEGYLDVIIAHQHGFQNVIATLGTALTERHLQLLGRRAAELILALDADTAGQAATWRGLEVEQSTPADSSVPVPRPLNRNQIQDPRFFAASADVRDLSRYVSFQNVRRSQLKIVTLPAGLDPDDLIRRGPDEWRRLVDSASPVVDFLLSRLGEHHDLASAVGKSEAVDEAVRVIRDLTNPVERDHYVQRLAALVGLDESSIRLVLRRLPARQADVHPAPRVQGQEQPAEAYALALHFLADPSRSTLRAEDLSTSEARAIHDLFATLDSPARDEAALASLADSADPSLSAPLEEVRGWLSRLAPLSEEQRSRELEVGSLKLRQQKLRREHQQVLALLDEPYASSDGPAPASLLSSIASQLKEIEADLAARGGIGSVVWRSRQVGEVLGG